MDQNYKKIIYNNYYSFHTKKLYGNVTLKSIRNQFKFWEYYFKEYLPENNKINILDAGCGNGGFAYWLFELGYTNSLGIDISEEMISLGKSLGISNIERQDIFEHLKVNKEKYNIIFCRDVLEHLTKNEIIEIFKLFNESLKPNGKIIIQVPNGFGPNYGKIFFSDFTHETLFTESALNQIALSTGFKFINVKEARPVPHGFISTVRFFLWNLLRMKYVFIQLIENGYSKGHFSQNIIAEISK